MRTSKQLVELEFICGKWNLFMGEVLYPIYTSSEMLCSCCTKKFSTYEAVHYHTSLSIHDPAAGQSLIT